MKTSKIFRFFAHRMRSSKDGNLLSFDEPYTVIARLLKGHTVTHIIDAGASTGRISQRLLRLFPGACVHAFEPNPIYADVLRRLSVENTRLKPEFYAFSDQEHTVELNITRSPGTTSLFKPDTSLTTSYPEASEITGIEHVKALTIDGWTERNMVSPVQFMKFDIQGGELKALIGASRVLQTETLVLYTEILFNSLYKGGALYSEIDLFLRKKGFHLYDIYKPRYSRKGTLLWGNALFVHVERLGMDI